jgi:hypothetical protein
VSAIQNQLSTIQTSITGILSSISNIWSRLNQPAILSPANGTYPSNNISLKITDTQMKTWYSLNNGPNVAFNSTAIIIASAGSNKLIVYANDSQGMIYSSIVYFTVHLGDINGDNKVNLVDLVTIASNYGKTYS